MRALVLCALALALAAWGCLADFEKVPAPDAMPPVDAGTDARDAAP